MQAADLLELRDDLERETRRLEQLVESLLELESRLSSGGETVEAAALRLHSFYTGVERILLLVSRVVNGGTPSRGEGWHRRLLERMAMTPTRDPRFSRKRRKGICRSICASATWCATSTPMSCARNQFNG